MPILGWQYLRILGVDNTSEFRYKVTVPFSYGMSGGWCKEVGKKGNTIKNNSLHTVSGLEIHLNCWKYSFKFLFEREKNKVMF